MEIIHLFQWSGHRDAVYTLTHGVNGAVISAGGDGNVVAWDPSNPPLPGCALFQLNGGTYCIQTPSEAYDGWIIGGIKGEMHFIPTSSTHDSKGVSPVHTPGLSPGHTPGDSPGNAHVHPPSIDQKTTLWNGAKGVNTGKAPIHDLLFMDHRLWSAQGDGRLLRWCVENPFPRIDQSYPISNSALRCLAPHPSAPYIASGSSDGNIRLTDKSGMLIQEFSGHTLSVFSLLFLAGGKYLLSGSRDAHLAVWETESGKLLERFPAHLGTLNQLVSIPEYGLIGSAGRDKEIRLWDRQTLALRKVINRTHYPLHGHTHSVNRLLWKPETGILLSAGDDRKIRAWQIT